jgi:hypothetical protein
MKNLSNKLIVGTIVPLVLAIVIGYIFYDKYSTQTVAYSGLGESTYENILAAKNDIIVTDEVRNSEKIEFVQRKITGGGINPGWVISLLETQPNVFTGRVIVDDGVYQHPVTLREEVTNILVGEMKSVDGKKNVFSMRKDNKECTDEEENIFEYGLSGTYGATQFLGCGGDVVKIAK